MIITWRKHISEEQTNDSFSVSPHCSSVRSRSLLSSSSLKELPCLVFFTPWEAERLRNPFHLCFVFFQMWSHSSPNPGMCMCSENKWFYVFMSDVIPLNSLDCSLQLGESFVLSITVINKNPQLSTVVILYLKHLFFSCSQLKPTQPVCVEDTCGAYLPGGHSQVSRVSTCQWVRCTLSRSELSSSSCRAPEELWTIWGSCFSPAKASIRSRLRIFTTAGLRRTNRWGERKASWADWYLFIGSHKRALTGLWTQSGSEDQFLPFLLCFFSNNQNVSALTSSKKPPKTFRLDLRFSPANPKLTGVELTEWAAVLVLR